MPPTAAAEPTARALAERVAERAQALARCSEEPDRLTRRFATPALADACALAGGWMRAAGMTAGTDAVGNLRGRYEGARAGAPALLLGSHLDTVRDAGRWDGALGVLVALAAVERLHAAGRRLPFALELAGFADEEGVRYGTAYLGSSALAGTFDAAWLARRDAGGTTMADALRAAGGDPDAVASARRDPATLLGYVEVHIEQGPALEAAGAPLGVVTGIAGQTRARLTTHGRAGHAGTVPMQLRRDALCAAAELVLDAEAQARATPELVATVGELAVAPGAGNVIPGEVALSLDVRHAQDAVRAAAVAQLRERAGGLAAARGVALDWETALDQPAVACDARLTAMLERAVAAGGGAP
ncbi:MAG TPA: Zn-dependent hydrolase, partial [Conexibacter sp.]|nr:Zn-dependent hydrolase [Conexibacter sp.]